MNDHLIKAIVEILGTSGSIILVIIGVVFSIMSFCIPFFVFQIMRDVRELKNSINEIKNRNK